VGFLDPPSLEPGLVAAIGDLELASVRVGDGGPEGLRARAPSWATPARENDYKPRRIDPVFELSSPDNRETLLRVLEKSNEVNITVTGRISKKKVSTPVWFVVDGRRVVLVPMKGSDNNWFKDLAKDPQIELSGGEITIPFRATLVRDSKKVEKVLDKFRAKYKAMWSESYYTKRDVCVEVPF
jgi:hypothetical protein